MLLIRFTDYDLLGDIYINPDKVYSVYTSTRISRDRKPGEKSRVPVTCIAMGSGDDAASYVYVEESLEDVVKLLREGSDE